MELPELSGFPWRAKMKVPSWRSNLAIFATISVLVTGYFFWQQDQALRQFRAQALEYSRILAAVVERNINNAIVSTKGLEGVIERFLENSCRFIIYLNGIEKFSSSELSAYALESGLAGVAIIPANGREIVSGPVGWLPDRYACSPGRLELIPGKHLYIFSLAGKGEKVSPSDADCVTVGLATGKIERLQKEFSVERLLQVLSNLHGIAYVRLEPLVKKADTDTELSTVALFRENNHVLSRAIFPMGAKRLVVTLEATHFAKRLREMRRQFGLFIVFLIIGGTLSTWWLFRLQRLRVQQAREFERTLARQHEEAALGRAAETITHEMRNPLNAIDMGLQRLEMEARDLAPDHRQLIVSMRDAVGRSDTIISSLRQYTRSFELCREPLVLADLITQVSTLYKALCQEHSIEVELDLNPTLVVDGDKALLGQLLENVIKNGIEAQPTGGFLRISLKHLGNQCEIMVVNAGCSLADDEIDHVFEPYFTTKGRGTGLGLAISKKIAVAHLGQCFCRVDQDNFYFSLKLPIKEVKRSNE